jgi:hypothetical protein
MIRIVARLCVLVTLASGLVLAGQSSAQAFSGMDCGSTYQTDIDGVRADTGTFNVDLGDDHYFGSPQGDAVTCWGGPSAGQLRVQMVGELYWDSNCCGAGWNQVSGNTGCGQLTARFSDVRDGPSEHTVRLAEVCNTSGSGLATRYYNVKVAVLSRLDHVRLTVTRSNSTSTATFRHQFGD